MGDLDKEEITQVSFLDSNYNNFEKDGEKNLEKKDSSESSWMEMFPDQKYKIMVLYSHSCHSSYEEKNDQFIKLLWHIRDQPEEVIP